jgi:hypothetical protein
LAQKAAREAALGREGSAALTLGLAELIHSQWKAEDSLLGLIVVQRDM